MNFVGISEKGSPVSVSGEVLLTGYRFSIMLQSEGVPRLVRNYDALNIIIAGVVKKNEYRGYAIVIAP